MSQFPAPMGFTPPGFEQEEDVLKKNLFDFGIKNILHYVALEKPAALLKKETID